MTVSYTVDITHDDDGDITVAVHDVGDSLEDRASIAYALREAADQVEHGTPLQRRLFQ